MSYKIRMGDPNALLDTFTQILAYIGNDGAKDGYFSHRTNTGTPVYSIAIRSSPLPEDSVQDLVDQIKGHLETGTVLHDIPEDVVNKINELKVLYDSTEDAEAKEELIQYINDFEVNPGMQGGKRSYRKRKTRRTNTKRRLTKKHRKTRSRRI